MEFDQASRILYYELLPGILNNLHYDDLYQNICML